MAAKTKKSSVSLSQLLARVQKEITRHSEFIITGKSTDFFIGVLKSSFVKAYEFARYSNKIKMAQADESSFFMTAGLRGICEDIITLKFIAQLSMELRQELVILEMGRSLRKAIEAQTNFFEQQRSFQPIIKRKYSLVENQTEKAKYTFVGSKSGLKSIKDKLPPVEQMAFKVGMKNIYDYFYRVTSETVHFNVHVALRNGWGPIPQHVHFGTKKFCRYYLSVNQVYGVFLFCLMCEIFHTELQLTQKFMDNIAQMRKELDETLRWPEPVTFEEMNIESPNPLFRVLLKVAHLNNIEKAQSSP